MRRLFLLLACLLFTSSLAMADKAYVAVASNFTKVAKELQKAFEEESGHRLVLSYGSTGKLYIQIKNGAPFSVFLSADVERPQMLEEEGGIVADSRFTYARGKIILYSRDEGLIDETPEILMQPDGFSKLAMANPKTAPYGIAAVETLKKLSAYDGVKSKIVRGENIAQTYQFVFTQNAQLGFVALSQVINEPAGSRWLVPEDYYSALNQQAVLLKKGQGNLAAQDFVDFLKGQRAKAIIQRYGYGVSL
ncbi:molybdate ABC transporter substrate-binding protein [Terasakiella sp. A23]|uniref:molybdate ABC transporter substrate-binding protein n=1 Tax=Terasakiella sp. FCG-A23 TaxID=3080561 RepID=UPI0029547E97|nr:molybdate ABC transporter substrate-binding protein [Terasakiella sp. A23]MDV7340086.1 molybdate ABC transporter substrate-binding protein [Terasakiella sp. A23]